MSQQKKTGQKDPNFDHLVKCAKEASYISPREYSKHEVKQGLRNPDGSGVKVGVTRISNVHGYDMVDGKKVPIPGQLLYRGIDVSQIADDLEREERMGYEEVTYLLLFGELPTPSRLNYFEAYLNEQRTLPDGFKENVILNQPSSNIMNYIQRMILALYSYDEDPDDTSLEALLRKGLSVIAKLPTMIAYAYMAQQHYFKNDSLVLHTPIYGSSAENILHMIRKNNDYTTEEARILDLLLIVHAEHGGGNNSAFTTNVISSSGTDIFSTLSAAVGSLKGYKHGGANLKAAEMLNDIHEHVSDPEDDGALADYLNRILDGKAFDGSGLIYGMGHAVYTITDPRAELLKRGLEDMVDGTDWEEDFDFVKRVEAKAIELMKERKGEDFEISSNVDLYSGFVYQILNIPTDLYTPIFATGRMAGWLAHILEQTSDGKIMRPAYATLPSDLHYVPLAERKEGGN